MVGKESPVGYVSRRSAVIVMVPPAEPSINRSEVGGMERVGMLFLSTYFIDKNESDEPESISVASGEEGNILGRRETMSDRACPRCTAELSVTWRSSERRMSTRLCARWGSSEPLSIFLTFWCNQFSKWTKGWHWPGKLRASACNRGRCASRRNRCKVLHAHAELSLRP